MVANRQYSPCSHGADNVPLTLSHVYTYTHTFSDTPPCSCKPMLCTSTYGPRTFCSFCLPTRPVNGCSSHGSHLRHRSFGKPPLTPWLDGTLLWDLYCIGFLFAAITQHPRRSDLRRHTFISLPRPRVRSAEPEPKPRCWPAALFCGGFRETVSCPLGLLAELGALGVAPLPPTSQSFPL